MDSDEHIVKPNPVPATMIPHASETIAAVLGVLIYQGGTITIPGPELLRDRGRVQFTEHADGSVTVELTQRDSG